MVKPQIAFTDFDKVDMRVEKIVKVKDFLEARKPAYKLEIDFGSEIGIKHSSTQYAKNQTKDELFGKQVFCVVNFAPKQLGPFVSEALMLVPHDVTTDASYWIPLTTLKTAPLGSKIFII